MKILKLLNKKYLSIIIIGLSINLNIYADDKPVDIWNIENDETKESQTNINLKDENNIKKITESDIYNSQSSKKKILF